jgi:hypothetical protein
MPHNFSYPAIIDFLRVEQVLLLVHVDEDVLWYRQVSLLHVGRAVAWMLLEKPLSSQGPSACGCCCGGVTKLATGIEILDLFNDGTSLALKQLEERTCQRLQGLPDNFLLVGRYTSKIQVQVDLDLDFSRGFSRLLRTYVWSVSHSRR